MTLAIAMILDAILGEPRWLWDRLPHPAVLMGRLVGRLDDRFNAGSRRRLKGALSLVGMCVAALAVGWLVKALPLAWLCETLLCAVLLAHRSLVDHVRDVAKALRLSVGDGRVMVARIVGRDTRAMDGPAIARASIESAAENFSDGVAAPIFWYAIGGLPGMLLYKMTNTADSMIGYRTPRHEEFGWAAARFDDLLNWIPARLTALLFTGLTGLWGAWHGIVGDARRHRSPNAGWPEAAMSRALDVAVAGPRSYDGEMREFPFVNPEGRHDSGPNDIEAAAWLLWRAWAALLGVAVLMALL
ncbi:Adenosylcobinamide-phosphate synthase [Candidatus Rhodobacter oscarellae]|uniref:Cobalamin biosynthesis protein CobD n=1 Tax=Candidatus Rhodobacter oscarellae TaxID=1675527 RepID=A0A0J9EFU1_9RHOB|nr:adenosylcobinamide-phosphate synthase CbiB [Candidatus Rhodobacter lobularis]KMW60554.1 Adenosylcobinamide-phosphate synthase [Candidatus Rhodobacter lobularis]